MPELQAPAVMTDEWAQVFARSYVNLSLSQADCIATCERASF